MKLGAALFGARGSDDATLTKIREIIDRARREIYAILASDDEILGVRVFVAAMLFGMNLGCIGHELTRMLHMRLR